MTAASTLSTQARQQLTMLRYRLGASQQTLANRMHICRSGAANLETLGRDIQLDTLQRWAEALGGRVRIVIEHPALPDTWFDVVSADAETNQDEDAA